MCDQFDPESATIDQMERYVAGAGHDLDRLEARLAAARRDHARSVDENPAVRATGSETMRRELDEHYRPALDAAEQEIETEIGAIRERLHAIRDRTATAEPTLTREQMADAANRLIFVEREARDWPLPRLVDALRHALVTDDWPGLYCYLRTLPARLADETPEVGQSGSDPAARQRAELRRMLGVAKERLTDPRFASVNQRALDVAVRASAAGREAGKRRHEEERKRRPYAFQSSGDVPWNQSQG